MPPTDLIGLAIPLTYLLMLGVEQRWPARIFPPLPWWRLTGALFVAMLLGINATLPLLLPPDWLARHHLLDLSWLHPIAGALLGHLVLTFGHFLFHRAEHALHPFWRAFHQLHHSPRRIDISGAAFTHPTEMLAMSALSLGITVFALGLDPLAAALAGYLGAFCAMFQHWNIRTPHWLGYIIQRPESHCLHHERGVHSRNFADLPLWDMLFGSFVNPPDYTGHVGFDPPADRRIGQMLGFADVNPAAPLGRAAP